MCSPSSPLRQIAGLHEGRISGSSQPQGAKIKQKSVSDKAPAEQVLKDIRRQTPRQYSAEEKIRIVLGGCAVRRTSPSFAAARASPPR